MSAESVDYAAYRVKELGLNTPLGLLGPLIIGAMFSALLFVVENPAIMVYGGSVSASTCNDYYDCYHCNAPNARGTSMGYYYDIPGWPGQATTTGDASGTPLWKVIGEGGANATPMYLMMTNPVDPNAMMTWQQGYQYHGCPCDNVSDDETENSMPYINAVRR